MNIQQQTAAVGSIDMEALQSAPTVLPGYEEVMSANPGEPGTPKKNDPEIEPEKMPNEDPGIQPNTTPKREGDDDDDDDDDDYTPYTEPEIGDDPDKEKVKVPIM